MANNLRYLLEHFCLDGQKIDISSQLDEENANNIEKINTQTVPSINARIDDIKNTDIPNINSRIDNIKNTDIPSINQKINTINNTTIPNVQSSVNAVDEKADRINESAAKNTRDIGTLSDNVTMQGNAINSIETEKIPSVENNVKIVARETQRISAAHEHDMNGINESLSALHDETSSNTTNIGNLTTNINDLTTKVNTNTDNINGLSTKVDTNTDSINTINNTSIPHLQSEIDNLSGGGTGSVGELREKVEKNTSDIAELNGKVDTNTVDISTLNGKVDSNTLAISTINDTSIPNLQNQINNIGNTSAWTKSPQITKTNNDGLIFKITTFTNGSLHWLDVICDFSGIDTPKINKAYALKTSDILLSTKDCFFIDTAYFIRQSVGKLSLSTVNNVPNLVLTLDTLPNFTSLIKILTCSLFYF